MRLLLHQITFIILTLLVIGYSDQRSNIKVETSNNWTAKEKSDLLEECMSNKPLIGMNEQETKDYCACFLNKVIDELPYRDKIGDSLPSSFREEFGWECLNVLGIQNPDSNITAKEANRINFISARIGDQYTAVFMEPDKRLKLIDSLIYPDRFRIMKFASEVTELQYDIILMTGGFLNKDSSLVGGTLTVAWLPPNFCSDLSDSYKKLKLGDYKPESKEYIDRALNRIGYSLSRIEQTSDRKKTVNEIMLQLNTLIIDLLTLDARFYCN